MRTLLTVASIVLLCTSLGTSAAAQGGPKGKPLTEQELQALLSGGALFDFERPSSGELGTVMYLANGEYYAVWMFPITGGQGATGKGTWEIEGDKLCKTGQTYMAGVKRCHNVVAVGENRYEVRKVPSGSLSSVAVVRK